MDIKQITDEQIGALHEALYFLKAFVEYHIDEEPVEPGFKTDAQLLSELLPTLDSVFANETVRVESPSEDMEDADAEPVFTKKEVEDMVYNAGKNAAESVNPNYKFCVVDSSLRECYLTDDEVSAMEFAIRKSKHSGMWNVCRIFKAQDGTYKTRIVSFADGGEYYESSFLGGYLHFNYIAEACGEVKKI